MSDAPAASLEGDASCGLLINVIRTLTTSASEDQKQYEKSRLERGFKDSAYVIDKLVEEHQSDVNNCLHSFRNVSQRITASRERIHNVKNALQTCKSLLQCRRDDLKKLWMENAEQRCVANILQQIEEIKNLDKSIDEFMGSNNYREAVSVLKKSDILLNGPLSGIEGLSRLRAHIQEHSQVILNRIIGDLLEILVLEPFECQLLELIKTLPEETINESVTCKALSMKYSSSVIIQSTPTSTSTLSESSSRRIAESLEALTVFDQLEAALDHINDRSGALCRKAVNDTVTILKIVCKDQTTDATHLVKLVLMVQNQLRNSYAAHSVLAQQYNKVRYKEGSSEEILNRFWTCAQDVLESLISDHLDIWPSRSQSLVEAEPTRKRLFRFDQCAFSGNQGTSKSTTKAQPASVICKPDPCNIVSIFHMVNRFAQEIESVTGTSPCKLNVFLNSLVMETFIERVKGDLERKAGKALSGGADVWSILVSVPTSNVKILASCVAVFELCEHVGNLIKNMEQYTQRFASLWLMIIADYTKCASTMYEQITRSMSASDNDVVVERRKISAAWAVDEDVSRFLKTLDSWTLINSSGPASASVPPTPADVATPSTSVIGSVLGGNESDAEIRRRNQRESDILISNIGNQNHIGKAEMITDMNHVRALACMHESLQWFAMNMRKLLSNLSPGAKQIIDVRIEMTEKDGQTQTEKLGELIEQRLANLESMSETCLLMLHLELRVHCFYHLLPLARSRTVPMHAEGDREAEEFGRELTTFYNVLQSHISPTKLKYLIDGLGHLCASIFISSSQHMKKLSENGRKRVCRQIFAVQQRLSLLTRRRESELDRARAFFELLNHDPDQLLALIMERGAVFSHIEYNHLLSLAVRSHPVLSCQPGALENRIAQLRQILDHMNKP
uniref:Exocyst complex component Sec8 n=1 Tax=Steinernema glaseri TaxID=37863 RepID=A0A1I7XYA3_9BILA